MTKTSSEHEAAPKRRWHPPELVTICLVSHLETVLIEGFKGHLDAMEVAKYFLRNGEALKKMTISSGPRSEEKLALYKELLVVPKACIVDFVQGEIFGFEKMDDFIFFQCCNSLCD